MTLNEYQTKAMESRIYPKRHWRLISSIPLWDLQEKPVKWQIR
jgi:hypothetical protein